MSRGGARMTQPTTDELARADSIRRVKRQGEISGLIKHIADQQFHLNNAWSNTKPGGRYKGLGEAIAVARDHLDEMEAALAALRELDPNHD